MSISIKTEQIANYYNYNSLLYNLFTPDSLHYGFWEDDTKNISQAHTNANKYIVNSLQIVSTDRVLDAGCGVGGTVVYIAEGTHANVTGITISPIQVIIAKNNAQQINVQNITSFHEMDYQQTEFEDEYFDKIYGLESICHAEKKVDFLTEAYRLLKPGGKLLVMDAFMTKNNLEPHEHKDLMDFLKGWFIPNIATKNNFTNDLISVGFKNIKFVDHTKKILPTVRSAYITAKMIRPMTWVMAKLGWIPESLHGTVIGSVRQKQLILDHKIGVYGVFLAEK